MNIIIATPTLYEKTSAFNHLLNDILEGFSEDGHKIIRIVACEKGKAYEGIPGIIHKNIQYIKVNRKRCDKGNLIRRYCLDNITALKMAVRIIKSSHAQVLLEDISYASFFAVMAARIRRMKIVTMIQDVWPDNAVKSGMLADQSFLYRYFDFWQKRIYKLSDQLICISEDMKELIVQKGADRDRIQVIYNWGYQYELINISWENNEFVNKYHLSRDKFYAVYAGNIGRLQNISMLIKTARRLQNNARIHFLIVGTGVSEAAVRKQATDYGLNNITLFPVQPQELAVFVYSMADVNLIPLVKGGIKTALPSKTAICLSCGKPVLFCLDTSSCFAKMIGQYKAGMVIEPNDSRSLAAAIEAIENGSLRIDSQDVLSFYADHFTGKENIEKYKAVIRKLSIKEADEKNNHRFKQFFRYLQKIFIGSFIAKKWRYK